MAVPTGRRARSGGQQRVGSPDGAVAVNDPRSPTPVYQPLRSQHVDVLLDRAGALLTHSLDLSEALHRLGDLLVPHFADWCSIALLDEQQNEWNLALTRHVPPIPANATEQMERLFGQWKDTGSGTQGILARGEPVVVPMVTDAWLEANAPSGDMLEIARTLPVRSILYMPLEIDGGLLGSLLLLMAEPDRVPYGQEDLRTARRLATFVAAVLRNAKLWHALRGELAERHRMERSLEANTGAMRTLSAGLGHDLGNLLQPLRLRLDSLSAMDLPRLAVADLSAIGRVLVHLQRLTTGLRMLAGNPRLEPEAHEEALLTDWWRDMEAVLKDALPAGIVLTCDLPPRLPPIRIADSTLTHIVFHLVQRAGQALRHQSGGTVRIWAERVARRPMIRLGVEDNVTTVDEEQGRDHRELIETSRDGFAPGSQGLALVRALVERAGGEIAIGQKAGPGTAFVFTIPVADRRGGPRRTSTLSRVSRVTLADPRTSWLVARALRACGFYVDETGGRLHGEPLVWVTDLPSASGFDAMLEFVLGAPHRVVVLVNAHSVPSPHPRVHVLPSGAVEAELRKLLAAFSPSPGFGPMGTSASE